VNFYKILIRSSRYSHVLAQLLHIERRFAVVLHGGHKDVREAGDERVNVSIRRNSITQVEIALQLRPPTGCKHSVDGVESVLHRVYTLISTEVEYHITNAKR
jgi:hypothetical protein